jgi:integrase
LRLTGADNDLWFGTCHCWHASWGNDPDAYPARLPTRTIVAYMAMTYDDLPRYLLAPEVAGLLHFLPDWTQHSLINLLWNTGARLNEALALRRRDFRLNVAMPDAVVRTAKQRRTGRGRPVKGKSVNRSVPLTDPQFVDELRRLFASTKEEFEIDGETGQRSPYPSGISVIEMCAIG